MRLLGGVRLWRERDNIVNTGNFNPEHSVFVLKMFYLYPIVTKASSSAMDVDAYWVYGFQAATDYVLQMTPLGGVETPGYMQLCGSEPRPAGAPKASSANVFRTGVDSHVSDRSFCVRRGPREDRAWSGKRPNCSSNSLAILDGEGANITDLFLLHQIGS